MIKIRFPVLLLISIFFVLSSCNESQNEFPEFTQETKNLLYVFQSPNSQFQIQRVIDASNINRGGYALIISDGSTKNNQEAEKLRNKFYIKQIIAVHNIILPKSYHLLNTDKIAIENAQIICFIGDFNNNRYFMNIKSDLGYFLNKAYNNSAAIVMFGTSALYCGTKYYPDLEKPIPNNFIPGGLDLIDYHTSISNVITNIQNKEIHKDLLLINDTSSFIILNRKELYNIDGNTIINK